MSATIKATIEANTSPLNRVRQIADFEGPAALGDAQLLALVLGRGGDGLEPLAFAQALLDSVGGLSGLVRLGTGGLSLRPGLGPVSAAKLRAAVELGRRAEREASRIPEGLPLSARGVADWAIPRLGALEHEEVWVLCLDSQTRMRSAWQVGRGGVHGCALVARDVLVPVVREAASAFVLVHNHPSGDPTPSTEDIDMTRGLGFAAHALCVPLLDHVIVARSSYRSLFELGVMDESVGDGSRARRAS